MVGAALIQVAGAGQKWAQRYCPQWVESGHHS